MTTLYYSKIIATAAAATTSAAGYPPANVMLEAIRAPWKATGVGANDHDLTWPAGSNLAGVILEDVNFAAATLFRSADGVTFPTNVGAITSYADKHTGRRRALVIVGAAGVRGIRTAIGAGASTDGLPWRIGAIYPFALSTVLARNFDYGSRVSSGFPQVRRDLPNGQVARAATGPKFLTLSLDFDRRFDQDVLELARRGADGTIGIDLNDPDYPEITIPAECNVEGLEERLAKPRKSDVTIPLREVV